MDDLDPISPQDRAHLRRLEAEAGTEHRQRRTRRRARLWDLVAAFFILLAVCGSLWIGTQASVDIDFSGETAEAATLGNPPDLDAVGLEALRFCESTHDYTNVNTGIDGRTGKPYAFYGAYQFEVETWDGQLVKMQDAGYLDHDWLQYQTRYNPEPELTNTPNQAPYAIQDHVTLWTWNEDHGHDRWPVCQRSAIQAMIETSNKRVAPIPNLDNLEAPVPTFTG